MGTTFIIKDNNDIVRHTNANLCVFTKKETTNGIWDFTF